MVPYIDMHCDTLMRAYMDKKRDIYELPGLMLDVKRLQHSGVSAQFFAMFMLPETMRSVWEGDFPEDWDYLKALLAIYEKTVSSYGEIIACYKDFETYQEKKRLGKISGILSVEDGRAVAGDMQRLMWLREKGVRMLAPLWNRENCFGYPNSEDRAIMNKGLTSFGKEAIEEMNSLGILVDVSHLSDGGFWDVAEISRKPFVASHSNCRAIAPHRRNLTDEMIRVLADKGGVMGLNFYGPFLNRDTSCMHSSIQQMLVHVKHMIKVGGTEIAAIGTDFDGMNGEFEIAQCSELQQLFAAMEREGFTPEQIEKVAYKNVERVLRENG